MSDLWVAAPHILWRALPIAGHERGFAHSASNACSSPTHACYMAGLRWCFTRSTCEYCGDSTLGAVSAIYMALRHVLWFLSSPDRFLCKHTVDTRLQHSVYHELLGLEQIQTSLAGQVPSSPPRLLGQQLLEGGHLHTSLLVSLHAHLLPQLARLAVKVLADLAPACRAGCPPVLCLAQWGTHP